MKNKMALFFAAALLSSTIISCQKNSGTSSLKFTLTPDLWTKDAHPYRNDSYTSLIKAPDIIGDSGGEDHQSKNVVKIFYSVDNSTWLGLYSSVESNIKEPHFSDGTSFGVGNLQSYHSYKDGTINVFYITSNNNNKPINKTIYIAVIVIPKETIKKMAPSQEHPNGVDWDSYVEITKALNLK